LREENEDQINSFLNAHPIWSLSAEKRWEINGYGDGFYLACLNKKHL